MVGGAASTTCTFSASFSASTMIFSAVSVRNPSGSVMVASTVVDARTSSIVEVLVTIVAVEAGSVLVFLLLLVSLRFLSDAFCFDSPLGVFVLF